MQVINDVPPIYMNVFLLTGVTWGTTIILQSPLVQLHTYDPLGPLQTSPLPHNVVMQLFNSVSHLTPDKYKNKEALNYITRITTNIVTSHTNHDKPFSKMYHKHKATEK